MRNIAIKPVRIIVFAKAPQPGFAKTRLIPALGEQGAAALAKRMLQHTLHEALAADIGTVELCAAPAVADAAWQGIELLQGIVTTEQAEGDLGARLAQAAARALAQGESVLLVGTDCMEMSADLLRAAARALHEHDAVIHCTVDGGYALLGLTQFSAFPFQNIPWSSDQVAFTTITRCGQLGWSLHVGQMLHDVDEPQDLEYLPEQWRPHVAA